MKPRRWPVCSIVVATCLVLPDSVSGQDPKVTRSRTIRLFERAGIERNQVPVEATVRFEKDAFKGPQAIRLERVEGDRRTPVALQVLGAEAHDEKNGFAPVPQTFVRIAFLADVQANGSAAYEISTDGKPATPGPQLKIDGQGVGLTIDTGVTQFELDKLSGQLLTFTPKAVANDRLVFVQEKQRGPKPFHWNPDVWAPPATWGHTSDWTAPVPFDEARHRPDQPPVSEGKSHSYFYREWKGPLLHRTTRWGKLPFVPQVDVSVTYTFHAGSPVVFVQSLMEVREAMQLHALRNCELVFSRHQFDTAVWIDRTGKVHTARCYDYDDRDKSFKTVAKLPADVPCIGLANERKGYGIAAVPLGMTGVNRFTGQPGDEQAHFTIRDYDEHGKGNPYNFLYFVRYLVFRDNYGPTRVEKGSVYAEQTAIVVFRLNQDVAHRYDELVQWQKSLANPLEVVVD
jgi:hypothetical protein